jgi:hypothetical protein
MLQLEKDEGYSTENIFSRSNCVWHDLCFAKSDVKAAAFVSKPVRKKFCIFQDIPTKTVIILPPAAK